MVECNGHASYQHPVLDLRFGSTPGFFGRGIFARIYQRWINQSVTGKCGSSGGDVPDLWNILYRRWGMPCNEPVPRAEILMQLLQARHAMRPDGACSNSFGSNEASQTLAQCRLDCAKGCQPASSSEDLIMKWGTELRDRAWPHSL